MTGYSTIAAKFDAIGMDDKELEINPTIIIKQAI